MTGSSNEINLSKGSWQAKLLWLILICGLWLGAAFYIPATNERFWMLLPLMILSGISLKVIPLPAMTYSSPLANAFVIVALISLPVLFYLGLCQLTNSPLSWTELLLSLYFFSACIELPLLYYFTAVEKMQQKLKSSLPVRFQLVAPLVVKMSAYLILIPVLLAVFAIHRPKLLSRIDQEDVSVRQVTFPSADSPVLHLSGELKLVPRSRGVVIVCHGVGANRSDIQPIVAEIQLAGFSTFSFDFRGHGRSDGHTVTYGLKERYDVIGAYNFLLEQKDLQDQPIFAMGVSMGGSSLLLALPEMPQVEAVVLDSAFADLNLMVHHQLRWFPAVIRFPMVGIARAIGWLETGHDLALIRPVDALPKVSQPITIIHGDQDSTVPIANAHLLNERCRNLCVYEEVPGARHIESAFLKPTRYRTIIQETFVKSGFKSIQ